MTEGAGCILQGVDWQAPWSDRLTTNLLGVAGAWGVACRPPWIPAYAGMTEGGAEG